MITIVFLLCILPLVAEAQSKIVIVEAGQQANFTYPSRSAQNNVTCAKSQLNPIPRNYVVIPNNGESVNITLSKVTKDDSGIYNCISNGDVKTIVNFYLIVVDLLTIKMDKPWYNARDGIVISCIAVFYVDPDLSLATVSFKLSYGLGSNVLSDNITTSTSPSSTNDRASYVNSTYYGIVTDEMRSNNITCMLTSSSDIQFRKTASMKVPVQYEPAQVTIAVKREESYIYSAGETLYCAADSYPLATVAWSFSNKTVECPNPRSPPSGTGSSNLTMAADCLGKQTWICTATWYPNSLPSKVVTDSFTFNVRNGNDTAPLEDTAKKRTDIGLGVGLGLGIPLLILLIALIVVFCCGVGRGSSKTSKEVKKPKPPTATTTKIAKTPLPAGVSVNPNPHAPPSYNQVQANGSPGIPDIGFNHLNGSGSNPVLNSSLDGPNINYRTDKGGASVNLGKADLGIQNRSFTNI